MKNMIIENAKKVRKNAYSISSIIIGRWSPRSMSKDEISKEELLPLFEAARWAPSSNNSQPWRFIIARRNTKYWKSLFDLLMEGNQMWVKNAAVLVVVISRKNHKYNEKPYKTHSFDTGASWENLALEGIGRGLVVHAMGGFDYEKAQEVLRIPGNFNVEAMIAIGKPGKKENLPQMLKERETPSNRKPLKELLFEGVFGNHFM